MPDDQNAPNVIYDVNERMKTRIGSKDYLRKMDGVTRKYKVSFGHPDMKRAFERFFYMTSKHVQVISVLGRSRLPDEVVDLIENQIKALIEIATKAINEDIDACDALMQANGITALGEPMAPLHVTVQVTSPLMRRFLEVLEKCDQLETMIDTLVIDEIVTIDRAENQKRHVKRLVRSISGAARQWEIDVRMKIQATDEEEARAEAAKAAAKRARRNGTAASGNGVDTDADALGEVPPADVSVSAPTQPAG